MKKEEEVVSAVSPDVLKRQPRVTDAALLEKLKMLMHTNIRNHLYTDAIFYADKILHLSINRNEKYVQAVYDLANCFFLNKEYFRSVQLIEKHALTYWSEKFRLLVAQAFLNAANVDACINVLEKPLDEGSAAAAAAGDMMPLQHHPLGTTPARPFISLPEHTPMKEHLSSIASGGVEESESFYRGLRALLLGKAYEAQENKTFAVKNYKEALRNNCENFEAFDKLFSNYLLTHAEKLEFMQEIAFSSDNLWLKDYYVSRIQESLREDAEGSVLVKHEDPCISSPELPPRTHRSNQYLDTEEGARGGREGS